VLASPQKLDSGKLTLTLVPGTVRAIRWAAGSGQRASRWNTVPTNTGDTLNLRDIEQALENYKRVPTAEADIQITPGDEPGTSDLVISHKQPWPFRLSASADDSGTRSTGKYQGSLTLSYDNWWTLSDLFYVTLQHDLGGRDSGPRGTQGHTVHYSVPFGYWLAAITASQNDYHQTVAGASQNYLYSGTSQNTEAKLSRIIHRDNASKTRLSLKGFQRTSKNYIDDAEVLVQRRVAAGLEWGLNHKRSWGQGSLEGNLNYRQGTGAWGSLPAPEEGFGEGTSRMRLWQADLNVQQPFELLGRKYNYSAQWRWQHNRTPLTPQDRFAIAGRYTVRGFDGLSVLSAERGWLVRNDISTPLTAQMQGYVAVDSGHVGGPSAAQLVGQSLTGAAMGLRGQVGKLQWDVFVGQPLSQPAHFKTATTTAGFSASVSF
jgi:hemolysin activation/secretion protein